MHVLCILEGKLMKSNLVFVVHCIHSSVGMHTWNTHLFLGIVPWLPGFGHLYLAWVTDYKPDIMWIVRKNSFSTNWVDKQSKLPIYHLELRYALYASWWHGWLQLTSLGSLDRLRFKIMINYFNITTIKKLVNLSFQTVTLDASTWIPAYLTSQLNSFTAHVVPPSDSALSIT